MFSRLEAKIIKSVMGCIFISSFFAGCGRAPDASSRVESSLGEASGSLMHHDYELPEGVSENDLLFRKGSRSIAGLTTKVHQSGLKICYSDSTNSTERKEMVKRSILKWVKALQPLTSKPLAEKVDLVSWNSIGCDAFVSVGNYSPAYTQLGKTPRVNIATGGWYGSETVILHEFGHAFGLLDTYNGRGGSCQAGQPSSVMCYAQFLELKQDDILGVQAVYSDLD